ncbi:MAG: monofunctional biosynthetic peptidoglycan transglycosylase [Halothiobacillaceae bacterium]|nr:MAG: monofunctional biosynthetic peptidoglycan transglycosylase [Halothiobacillaceae bacterium]
MWERTLGRDTVRSRPKVRSHNFFRRWLQRGLLLLLALFLLVQGWYLAHILAWRWLEPSTTAFMGARLAELREDNPKAGLRQQWVDYPRISNNLKRAVIAAEDAKFLEHEGFDWEGMQNALEKNLRKGRVVAGGSTISQQLAKNLFLSGEKSIIRKGQEALITLMIEGVLPKRRILELYLNLIEWGDGVFGAEAAARHYFGVPAAQLTPSQAAWMAGIAPSPRHYDGGPATAALQRRIERIQRDMSAVRVP